MNQVSRRTLASKAKQESSTPKAAPAGRKRTYADGDVITLLVTENPKKQGNKNWPWFQAIMDAVKANGGKCTVAQAITAGTHMGEMKYDVEHKFIEIEPAPKKAEG